ncbi:hypothetical protein [Streptomyces sp. Sge12]|uniref:hypothetical protein n=1 Tax=Streptomyces sp. Sge12 TaxID=1972846 RepID=UPI003FCE0DDC
MEAHPQLDVMLVQSAVRTAYEELRYARVRTCLPVENPRPGGAEPSATSRRRGLAARAGRRAACHA